MDVLELAGDESVRVRHVLKVILDILELLLELVEDTGRVFD